MWVRCPECGRWCFAEKKGFIGRFIRSFVKDDKALGDEFGELGETIGMKGLGKSAGRAMNAVNIYKHGGEMLNGDNYRFYCKCDNEFGTDDESVDMSEEHELWIQSGELSRKFPLIKNSSDQEKIDFTKNVQEVLAKVENTYGIDEAKATLYDILACCYHFFFSDSRKAISEINKSLALYDDEESHVLKGIFMGKAITPVDHYNKMNELLNINECDSDIKYIDKATVLSELKDAEKNYGENFTAIPEYQRKFLVVTSEYSYLPSNSFKVLKYNDAQLGNIVFKNGVPNNNAIYVCHPYKSNVYYPAETYQMDLFENQLNEFRELLQCLGAKSITTENNLSNNRDKDQTENLSGKVGAEYKGVGANLSGKHNTSHSEMNQMVQSILIGDEFSLNPNMPPFVPEDLVWYNHMEEWQRLARMRIRGQNRYNITINTSSTLIVNGNEANQVNAGFNYLVTKANLEISTNANIKASETKMHEWKLAVEFYPLSDYKKAPAIKNIKQPTQQKTHKKNSIITIVLVSVILVLIAALIVVLL